MTMMSLFGVIPAFLALGLVSDVSASDGCFNITAAFKYKGAVYFVDGNDFIKLKVFAGVDVKGTIEGYFLLPGNVDAVLANEEDGYISIFMGNVKGLYNYNTRGLIHYEPISETVASFASGVDAVSWFQQWTYYFKGCKFYAEHYIYPDHYYSDVRLIGLPCNVDAAVNTSEFMFIIKGDKYWVMFSTKRAHGPYDLKALCSFSDITLCK